MIGDSSLRASLDRHRLLGIEPVVDPISPMLHQLRARAEKRERSVANVEFRSRGAAVEVGQICFGVAPAPSLIVRNSEIRRDRFNFPMPTKMPTNWTDGDNFLPVFSTRLESFRKNMESNQWFKLLFLLVFSAWCPWPVTG